MKHRWDGDHVLMDSTQNGKGKWSLACWKQHSFSSLVSIAPVPVNVVRFQHGAQQVGTRRLNWDSEKTLADEVYKSSDPNKKDQRDGTRSVSHFILSHYNSKLWSWDSESLLSRRNSENSNYFCSCVTVSHFEQKGRLSAWLAFIPHNFFDFI